MNKFEFPNIDVAGEDGAYIYAEDYEFDHFEGWSDLFENIAGLSELLEKYEGDGDNDYDQLSLVFPTREQAEGFVGEATALVQNVFDRLDGLPRLRDRLDTE